MSFFAFFIGFVLLVWVLLRQVAVRPVPRVIRLGLPVVIGVIGLFELTSYANSHHDIASSAWVWVLGTLLVGAIGLGIVRGLTVKIWTAGNWVLRQGTPVTMALWLVSLAVHFAGDVFGLACARRNGPRVGQLPALPRADPGRADGRGAPAGAATVGTTRSRSRQPAAGALHAGAGGHVHLLPHGRWPAPGPGGGPPPPYYEDPNIIDAEVVEDDDDQGRPELPPSR